MQISGVIVVIAYRNRMKMVDTSVTVVETVKSPVPSSSSTTQIVQQQSEQSKPQEKQQDSIKSLDLQCDEEFDEALAERPNTSHNHSNQQQQYHQKQQEQQQQKQDHSTDNHASISNGGNVDNFVINDSPCKLWEIS